MNALQSYLRHLIVTGIVISVERFKLPIEGAAEAANFIALAAVMSASWLATRYGPVVAGKFLPAK